MRKVYQRIFLILISLFTIALAMDDVMASEQEVSISEAIARETYSAVHGYFHYENRQVSEIWNLKAYKCVEIHECIYYVDSYARAQLPDSSQLGLYKCYTLIQEQNNELVKAGNYCHQIKE